MRVFIYQLDLFVGSTLAKRCAEEMEECEVIGTTADPKYRKPKWVQRLVPEADLSAMKEALLTSDIIVYELDGKSRQVTSALKVLLRHDYDEDKVLIGISSLMSWAKSGAEPPTEGEEGEDGEAAPPAAEGEEGEFLTWEQAADRKPHPNYKANVTSENIILTKGNVRKPMLKTYVVWPGVLFGNGESVFHTLFKSAWHCSESLPVIGDGNNVIPTIHVHDLAGVLMAIMNTRPEDCQGYVAVDNSHNTLHEIVTAISKTLSNGAVKKVQRDEYLEFMTVQGETHVHSLMMELNLQMSFSNAEDLGVEWRAQGGLVENAAAVVEEFRESRTLQPMRVMLYGPPASGKSFYAKELADEYELPLIRAADVIAWAREGGDALATEVVRQLDGLGDEEEEASKKKKPPKKGEPVDTRPPRLTDETLVKVFRKRLWVPECRNQGWILDGFPKTQEQAKLLFEAEAEEAEEAEEAGEEEEGEPEEGEDGEGPPSWEKKVKLPECMVLLEAPDELLQHRLMELDDETKAGTHNTEDEFRRRLTTFREKDTPETAVTGLIQDNKVRVLNLDAAEELQVALDTLRLTLGNPRNYHPNRTREARELRMAEDKAKAEEAAAEAKAVAEAEERQAKERVAAAERERLTELAMQERAALDTRSLPLRKYLMDNVLPILTKGLLEVSKVRPQDPVDFLAEFLFKQDPEAA